MFFFVVLANGSRQGEEMDANMDDAGLQCLVGEEKPPREEDVSWWVALLNSLLTPFGDNWS